MLIASWSAPMLASLCASAAVLVGVRRSDVAVRRVHRVVRAPRPDPWRAILERVTRWGEALAATVRSRRNRQARERRTRAAVISLCDGLAAELTAGRPPEAALLATLAVLDIDLLRGPGRTSTAGSGSPMGSGPPALFGPQGSEVAAATLPEAGTSEGGRFATGIEMADLLDQASSRPGAEGLRLLAACWRIGAESGGTFASVVDGLAMALRDEEAHREEVAAQLAGPRATARLLAGLPLLGLAMAAALGAHPVTFLLSTWPGICCLILGAVLDVAGLAWTRRIAESAECPG